MKIAACGTDHISAEIRALLSAKDVARALMIATLEGEKAILLKPCAQGVRISTFTADAALEETLRSFFMEERAVPKWDYAAKSYNGKTPRQLAYFVPADCDQLADLCSRLVIGVFKLPESAGLEFERHRF